MPPKRKTKLISAADLTADVARDLIRTQQAGQELAEDKVLWLSKLNVAPCQGACKANDKANPSCFCHLAPAEKSFKKKGLWKKEPDILGKLGADPADRAREDPAKPCGLSNLGNTCYVNSALQCLFMVPSFRWGLYKAPSPVADQEIMAQLRQLFLALDFGPRNVVDPTTFANCLNLNHTIQQDGQEFFKLLLTKVQDLFSKCSDKALSSLVARLFCGQFSYITVCKKCGRASNSSSNANDFYELPLQVKGFANLMESMVSALSAEVLEKENQYACENCRVKTDASRQQVLRQLPPYLCMQLQRFVFDYNKMDKMKVNDKFSFPLTLDMPTLLASVAPDHDHGVATRDAAGDPAGSYELCAVLIHKGNSASHGHYVAHIKAPDGQWWRFDDEAVTSMGPWPTSTPQDHGIAPASVGKAHSKGGGSKGRGSTSSASKKGRGGGGSKKGRKRPAGDVVSSDEDVVVMDDTSEEEEEDQDSDMMVELPPPKSARSAAGAARGRGRQGRGGRGGVGRGGKAAEREDVDMEGVEGPQEAVAAAAGVGEQQAAEQNGAGPSNGAPPPSFISSSNAYMLLYRQVGWHEESDVARGIEQLPAGPTSAVHEMLSAFEAEKMVHAEQRQAAQQRVEERRTAVRTMLACAPMAQPNASGGMLVPTSWLESWCTDEQPPAWDVAPLMCPHGRLDPAKSLSLKRVSEEAWAKLCEKQPLEPVLTAPGDVCRQCLMAQLHHLVGADSSVDVRKELEALVAVLKEGGDGGAWAALEDGAYTDLHYISKQWLQGWLKRKVGSMNTESSPTTNITCPHGKLLSKASTIAIPGHLWHALKQLWLDAAQWQASHAPATTTATGPRASPGPAAANGSQPGPSKADQQQVSKVQPTTPIADTLDEDGLLLVSDNTDAQQHVAHVTQHVTHVTQQAGEEGGESVAGSSGVAGGGGTSSLPATCVDFPVSTSQVCGECEHTRGRAEAERSQLRKGVEGERQMLPTLALVLPDLQQGVTYHMVPRSWLAEWRAYVSQGPRKVGQLSVPGTPHVAEARARPGPLLPALAQVLCTCHPDRPHLRYAPPEVVAKRSKYVQASPETDELVLIHPDDYAKLWMLYPPPDTSDAPGDSSGAPGVVPSQPMTNEALAQLRQGLTAQLVLTPRAPAQGTAAAAAPPTDKEVPAEAIQEHADQNGVQGPAAQGPGAAQGPAAMTVVLDDTPDDPATGLAGRAGAGTAGIAGGWGADGAVGLAGVLGGDGAAGLAGGRGANGTRRQPRGTGAAEQADAPAGAGRGGSGVAAGGRPKRAAAVVDPSGARKRPWWAGVTGMADGEDGEEDGEEMELSKVLRPQQGMVPVLLTTPPVCELYVQEVRAESKRKKLTYEGAELMCELMSSEEELAGTWAVTTAGGQAAAGMERRSRRSRRGRHTITISSWNTLADLKMQIFQYLDVHPGNAQVYVRGFKLEGDERTLADLEVYPGEEVRVLSSGDADPSDLTSLFPASAGAKGRRREVETGFKDTALLSGAGPPAPAPLQAPDGGAAAAGDAGPSAPAPLQAPDGGAAAAGAVVGSGLPAPAPLQAPDGGAAAAGHAGGSELAAAAGDAARSGVGAVEGSGDGADRDGAAGSMQDQNGASAGSGDAAAAQAAGALGASGDTAMDGVVAAGGGKGAAGESAAPGDAGGGGSVGDQAGAGGVEGGDVPVGHGAAAAPTMLDTATEPVAPPLHTEGPQAGPARTRVTGRHGTGAAAAADGVAVEGAGLNAAMELGTEQEHKQPDVVMVDASGQDQRMGGGDGDGPQGAGATQGPAVAAQGPAGAAGHVANGGEKEGDSAPGVDSGAVGDVAGGPGQRPRRGARARGGAG